MAANAGNGLVTIKLAGNPFDMQPAFPASPIAYALFMVAALMASSGVIFNLMQASEITKLILPDGDEPGL